MQRIGASLCTLVTKFWKALGGLACPNARLNSCCYHSQRGPVHSDKELPNVLLGKAHNSWDAHATPGARI